MTEGLEASDIEPFLTDLAARFDGDGLEDILGGVFKELMNMIAMDRQGLTNTDPETSWRAAVAALEGLVSVKPIAAMVC